MCRAIWVLAIASTDDACRRLRALAGAESQVVATATDAASVKEALAQRIDAVVLDARTGEARAILDLLVQEAAGLPIVWIGESAPPGTKITVSPERVSDDLPRAILRAVSTR